MATDTRDGETLDGVLERYMYRDESSSFAVAKLSVDGQPMPVTIVGELVGVNEGLPLRLRGQWVEDKKFGKQFRVVTYQLNEPNTLVGIERFLGSGLINGIGPEIARRMVEHFGMDTLEVIGRTPARLTEVTGIGASRATKIAEAFAAQRHVQDVMVFLRGHGVSAGFAARIVKRYGNEAINVVRENPYRLARDVWGIGFRTADGIAEKLGIARDAPARLEAGLLFALDTASEDGHVHLPDDKLMELAAELLRIDMGKLAPSVTTLAASGLIIIENLPPRGRCVSLPRLHSAETEAAARLREIINTPARSLALDIDAAIVDYEVSSTITLATQQKRAVAAALLDKCAVITGGPGVGKTTIVRGIVHLARLTRRRIMLAAPTGRAAKRMSEATGAEAVTLHRLLEYQPHEGKFAKNLENLLEVDIVVVDETSMVDILLFRALLDAIPVSAQLVLVGDIDQLPSVGPGAVLTDVIDSEAATVIRLTEIFRQAAASKIVTSAHRINSGELPVLDAPRSDSDDFFFIERDDPIKARETIVELVAERIPTRFGFDPITQVQVLTPMHRGELGTEALNAALQARLVAGAPPNADGSAAAPAPVATALRRGDRQFRTGDKVMQLRNDYDRAVFNGDIGVVTHVDGTHNTMRIDFGDAKDPRFVDYERNDLDQLTHAFAVSIHKSQGSEYPAVVMPISTQHFMMLQRSLLYTAVTRGKKLVVIVGSKRALGMAVRNAEAKKRMTWLAERLRD
ncbi:MAG TPA: ATP-dependent RecD-like DNA helicase [Kofleriaceae bacterium]|nr:ATP-dependent RecD-like DNA helicase [Kofleriaceae bacterium]